MGEEAIQMIIRKDDPDHLPFTCFGPITFNQIEGQSENHHTCSDHRPSGILNLMVRGGARLEDPSPGGSYPCIYVWTIAAHQHNASCRKGKSQPNRGG